jgi:DNA polymerase III subunit epsilon
LEPIQATLEKRQVPLERNRGKGPRGRGLPHNLTPGQLRVARRKRQIRNWRHKVQIDVDKREIKTPVRCGLVVFDLEMAGYAVDDITEICAVRVDAEGHPLAEYQQLVKPRTRLNKRVIEMTGITKEMLQDKPPLEEVLDDFFRFVGTDVVLGHDIGYNDIMSINLACRRLGRKLFKPRFLDTSRLAKRLLTEEETGGRYGLDSLLGHYGLHADTEHRAMADCYSALVLYRQILADYERRQSLAKD